MSIQTEIAQRIDKALDGDCGYGVGEHLAEQLSSLIAAHDAKVRAEALREFAHSIPGDVHDPRHVADLARGVADRIEREAGL